MFSTGFQTFFFDLIRRWLVLALLLGFLGALGTLHGELVRSPFSLGFSESVRFFFCSMPVVAAQFLPLCAVLGVVWFCRDHRESRAWTAQRISGHGVRFLMAPLSCFVLVMLVTSWFFSVGLSGQARHQQQLILMEHGEIRSGESLNWAGVSLLSAPSHLSSQHKLVFASEQDSLVGVAEEVVFVPGTQSLVFRDGEMTRLRSPRVHMGFSSLRLETKMAALSATKERRQAESYKAWTWPLLGVVLVGLGFVFGLEGRSGFVWVNCLGAWCLVRVCDHQLALLGPIGVAVVPLFVWSFGLFWKIRRWEEQ